MRTSQYVRLSEDTDVKDVIDLVTNGWKMPAPKVLISVTGAAQRFRVQPQVVDVVNQGLVRAAKQTAAWIITGGTDTGVMKLVGDAVRKSHVDVPVIGIMPWAAVHGREQLVREPGELVDHATFSAVNGEDDVRFYRPIGHADSTGAPLNPNHTHFIFTDTLEPDGDRGSWPWGYEIAFRMNFEAHVRDSKRVPNVLLVLNGGDGTLRIIERAVADGTPVVLVRDSGGVAFSLAHFMQSSSNEVLIDETGVGSQQMAVPEAAAKTVGGIAKWKAKLSAQMARIKVEAQKNKCLHSFNVRSMSGTDANLDLELLRAIVLDSDGQIAKRWTGGAHDDEPSVLAGFEKVLQLSIEWGEREIVQHLLLNLPTPSGGFVAAHRLPAAAMEASEGSAVGPLPAAQASRPPPSSLLRGHSDRQLDMASSWHSLLAASLELALRMPRHAAIVNLLLEQDARPEHVDLMELWSDPSVTRIYRFDVDLGNFSQKHTTGTSFKALHSPGRWPSNDGVTSARLKSIPEAAQRAMRMRDQGDKYHKEVVPLIMRICRLPTSIDIWPAWPPVVSAGAGADAGTRISERARRDTQLRAQLGYDPLPPRWTAKDLFLWSLFNPQERGRDLAYTLWRHCQHPIREALVASYCASELAKVSRTDPDDYLLSAKLYESWAVGVLDQCTDHVEARAELQAPFAISGRPATATATPMHLAIRLSRKKFLAHAHAQSLLDAVSPGWRRGGRLLV